VDTVITQSPTAGKKVASGSTVNYVKSLGKPIVPNVVGMIPADASTAITSVDNLKVGKVTSSYSDTVTAGVIISQSPAAGTMVSVGSKVKYIISLGKPIVPNVVGKSAAKANAAIKSIDNLKVGTITTAHSDTVAAGVVISQSPDAGTEVATGSQVNYVKSLGKPVVPKIVGKLADEANTAIVNADLVVGDVTTAYSNKVAVGKIISQSPAAGKKVTIGSAVNYVISLGKQL
jgi:serine/threonine-protein kinase